MKQKRVWDVVGLFLISLVIMLPIYSANAMAINLDITKNQGEAGIEGFIDGNDIWEVDVKITGAEAVIFPVDVILQHPDRSLTPNSCNVVAGGTLCSFSNPWAGSGSDQFSVTYQGVRVLDRLTGDSTPPKVTFRGQQIWQVGREVYLNFAAKDLPDEKCVGLKQVRIVDGESGSEYFSKNDFPAEFCDDFIYNEALPQSNLFSGDGRKKFIVMVEDRLGNKDEFSKNLDVDFILPIIDSESIIIKGGLEYIGPEGVIVDIELDVTENKRLDKVTAIADGTDIEGKEANCNIINRDLGKSHCVFENVEIGSLESVSFAFSATDRAGNIGSVSKTFRFFKDNDGPNVEYFQTVRTYDGNNYVKPGKNRIILRAHDQGSKIELQDNGEAETIVADLSKIGGSVNANPKCKEEGSQYDCHWDTNRRNINGNRIKLTQVQDRVGNNFIEDLEVDAHPTLIIDSEKPILNKLELFGISGVVGEKNYFQSHDQLKIKMQIKESSGFFIKVNMDNVINGADQIFEDIPESEFNEKGWATFDETYSGCSRDESLVDIWNCELIISERMRDTYLGEGWIDIVIEDTAGNLVDDADWKEEPNAKKRPHDKGKYYFELLQSDNELEEPDFWELAKTVEPSGFIDLDVTNQINTRISATVNLKSEEDVKLRKIELVSCIPNEDANAPEFSRPPLMYGGVGHLSKVSYPTLVFEYVPFPGEDHFSAEIEEEKESGTFDKIDVPYTCVFKIFSEIPGSSEDRSIRKATTTAELEKVEVVIPFGYSTVGTKDVNAEKKINDIKELTQFKLLNKIGVLTKILKWAKLIHSSISSVASIKWIMDLASSNMDGARFFAATEPLASGLCEAAEVGFGESAWGYVQKLQEPLAFFSCIPDPNPSSGYGAYQESVLNTFNLYKGAGVTQSVSLYDNIYVSTIGACVPGIIYNLDKLRQAYCVQISCLENDVPAGRATVDTCNQMFDILSCKYFKGELHALIWPPFTGLIGGIKDFVRNVLTNQLAWVRASIVYGCAASCPASSTSVTICDYLAAGVKAVDVIESGMALYQQYPTIQEDKCSEVGL